MHDTVTTTSSPTAIYPTPLAHKLSQSLAHQPRPLLAIKDSLGWFYSNDSPVEPSFEHWNLSSPEALLSSQRAISPEFRKFSPLTIMPTRTSENTKAPTATQGNNAAAAAAANQRWQYNHAGQYVDMGAEAATWELADEIGRLNMGDVSASNADDARFAAAIRTPPKSKLVSASVAQAAENSPLDTASNSSASPHVSDHPISHSRGSSADSTTLSSRDSVPGNNLLTHAPVLTQKTTPTEAKGRPHSFSGGLSSADLRRLQEVDDSDHDRQVQQQQQQRYREQAAAEQQYPSLSNQQVHRPAQQQPQPQQQSIFTYPSNAPALGDRDREDSQFEYNAQQQHQQQRNFAPPPPPHMVMSTGAPPPPPQFAPQARPNNNSNYRQAQRSFAPQTYGGGHHTSHLSLGNTQQLYEMMIPNQGQQPHQEHPAVARVQQQHNVFRQTHHHSASDPSAAMRDINALTMGPISSPMPPTMASFTPPGMFPAPALMPPPPQQAMQAMYAAAGQPAPYYSQPDMLLQQQAQMAARVQAQYTGPYGAALPAMGSVNGLERDIGSPTSSSGQTGPSANNRKLGLYKTELCRSWEEKGSCRYGSKCQFAHGEDELRKVARHPKYKTEICKTFWVSGSCPYGKRCCFIHTETSAGTGAGAATEGTPPPPTLAESRGRSNSDPDGTPISMLARISRGSHQQEAATPTTPATPGDSTPNGSTLQFSRPAIGPLRIDTSALDSSASSRPQNKSAYPSFAGKGIVLPAPEQRTLKSPAPVTAGPDLGRHNISRMEIVGYSNHQKKNSTPSNPRHSFTGSEDISYSQSPPATADNSTPTNTTAQSSLASGATAAGRVNGHVRSGSAGNWGGFGATRSSTLATSSAYPHAASPAGEIMSGPSPWSSTELAVGTSRLHEKAWA